MTPAMRNRLDRLEKSRKAGPIVVAPGLIPVLMYGIAVRLGGYLHTACHGAGDHGDDVCDGFARGLGYENFTEMDRIADEDVEAWGARMQEGVNALYRSDNVELDEVDDTRRFGALVRILDRTIADRARGTGSGWDDMDDRLDDWIRFSGLSPAAIRSEVGT